MGRELVHSFTIKIVPFNKPKRESSNNVKVSRKCYAVVIKDKNVLKARINISPVEDKDEFLILDFTSNSLNLKGKTHVFLKDKDKYNHYVCVIRDIDKAYLFPGVDSQYDALHENLLIAGYIVRKEGKLYFDYKDLIAFHENGQHIENVKILENKPIFNNEYNRDKSS